MYPVHFIIRVIPSSLSFPGLKHTMLVGYTILGKQASFVLAVNENVKRASSHK